MECALASLVLRLLSMVLVGLARDLRESAGAEEYPDNLSD